MIKIFMIFIIYDDFDDDNDQDGRPTRDPRKYKAGGALLPAGGPKVSIQSSASS